MLLSISTCAASAWFEHYIEYRLDELRLMRALHGRGLLTLVHFSAQPEPFLTQNTPWALPNTPNTP